MKNVLKHLKKILIHKWWVFYYACQLGIVWQGLIHDLSKFSWVEFRESIKYYQGDKSPIPIAKEKQGYSEAWLHHKGRNKHHYEYWIDWKENSDILLTPMPYNYVLELIADYLGAYRSYNGYVNLTEEYDWWAKKREHAIIHPATKHLISNLFMTMINNEKIKHEYWRKWYLDEISKWS